MLVRVIQNPKKILNDSMIDWINLHQDTIFKVDRIVEDSVKLFKVDFWISKDLIEEVV
jgi:hypothetical protein